MTYRDIYMIYLDTILWRATATCRIVAWSLVVPLPRSKLDYAQDGNQIYVMFHWMIVNWS